MEATTTNPTIQFGKQYSMSAFKAKCQADKLDVIKSPITGKLFFVCGDVKGKVSSKGFDNPVITQCTDEDGVIFYMMHSQSETNVIASF
jgi:hypothetical protein